MGKGAGSGGSVYNQSANALGQAGNLYGDAATLYGSASGGYKPTTGTASTVAQPGAIAAGIPQYMNPYTSSVIDAATGDVQRMVDQQQQQNAAKAASMGAFGGSRAGLVEATTNSEGQRNIGEIAANLRNTGWNTAAGLAGQDIQNRIGVGEFNAGQKQGMTLADMAARNQAGQFNSGQALAAGQGMAGLGNNAMELGKTGFNIGQQIGNQQMMQGGMQQALMQQIMGLAGGQYGQFMQHPTDLLSMQLQALGMNPRTAETTTTGTTTPGLLDYLSAGAQAYGTYAGLK